MNSRAERFGQPFADIAVVALPPPMHLGDLVIAGDLALGIVPPGTPWPKPVEPVVILEPLFESLDPDEYDDA